MPWARMKNLSDWTREFSRPLVQSPENEAVKQARKLLKRKGRQQQGAWLVEGVRFAEEALGAGVSILMGFCGETLFKDERGRAIFGRLRESGAPLYPVAQHVLATLSETQTPQGIVLLVQERPNDWQAIDSITDPLLLVIDGVQDPGNLGTSIRAAAAAGAAAVITTPGTVDVGNPKALRSTMGAVFRVPLLTGVAPDELIRQVRRLGIRLYLLDAHEGALYTGVDLRQACALIVGGEAWGPRAEQLASVSEKLRIPLSGGVESLNAAVAAAVCLFEAKRQRDGS